MKTLALLVMLSALCASLGAEPPAARLAASERSTPLPQRLSDTGLRSGLDFAICPDRSPAPQGQFSNLWVIRGGPRFKVLSMPA